MLKTIQTLFYVSKKHLIQKQLFLHPWIAGMVERVFTYYSIKKMIIILIFDLV